MSVSPSLMCAACSGGDEAALKRLGADAVDVDAGAVIGHLDDYLAALMERAQEQASFGGLAGGEALLRQLDTMIDRVAHDVGQGIADRLDEGLVELGLLTLHLDAHLLAACEREVADDTREFVPDVADGLHPGLHDPFLQFGGDQVEALRGAEEAGFLLAQRKLQNLIADQHQLADQVHHLVEQIHVDADAALGGRRSGRGFMAHPPPSVRTGSMRRSPAKAPR